MNDYLIRRARDIPRVAINGLRFRRAWPETEGALGLWMASSSDGRRQVSVSVWRTPEDLRRFVRTPAHLRVMRDFRHVGQLYTNAWTAPELDRGEIWRQALDRLTGRVPEVPHH
jgi:heme-degrading monooxygenase HmoA